MNSAKQSDPSVVFDMSQVKRFQFGNHKVQLTLALGMSFDNLYRRDTSPLPTELGINKLMQSNASLGCLLGMLRPANKIQLMSW